jgi:hypothetical protein
LTRWFPNNPISRRYLARQFLEATEPFEVDQVGGAFMLFRQHLLADVGFLDEGFLCIGTILTGVTALAPPASSFLCRLPKYSIM